MTAPTATVVSVDAASDPRWAELVQTQRSDVFHSPPWARVLSDTYGFDVRANLVVDEHDRPTAGMAYVDVDDPRGRRVLSLPFSDFCDPLVSDPTEWKLLADALPVDDVSVTIRCLRHEIDANDAWSEAASFAWHRIDTHRSSNVIWDSLHPSARRAIRKAQSSGVEVLAATSEADLRAFYDLYLGVRKHKYGLLAQPYRFFEAIWEHFLGVDEGRLLLARVGSEVVGGVLYLQWKDTLYYKFNASAPSELGVRPNDLLVWEGLGYAQEQGLDWLDFGVSDWDQEGLVRYKSKYATEQSTVRKFTAGPTAPDPLGPILSQLTALLVDPSTPNQTTEKAGNLLYKYFA